MSVPLVSIVVPVYNGAAHLSECLRSVCAQSYANWNAIIVDNCSCDGTAEIAEAHAQLDSRLRVIHCREFLGQAENYNRSLAQVAEGAEYIKIVEADNWIVEDCIARMVAVGESHPQVGLVGCYYLCGRKLVGDGVDYSTQVLSGREVVRLMFREHRYLLGTPTTLLFRASALRGEHPWFRSNMFYDDAELCFRLLRRWELGYVHQVLAFHRWDNQGTLSSFREFDYIPAYRFFLMEDFGADYLEGKELKGLRRQCRREYSNRLGRAVLSRRSTAYWRFHAEAFRARGRRLEKRMLIPAVLRELVELLLNPKSTFELALRSWRRNRLVPGSARQ